MKLINLKIVIVTLYKLTKHIKMHISLSTALEIFF